MNDNSSRTALQHRGWVMVGGAMAVALLLALGGEPVRQALRYDRAAVASGQLWRLITAHWVHGSTQHIAVNVLGAALMAALFNRTYCIKSWLIILACGVASIDLGFWFLMPQLQWYVGMSGVLHAVLAAGTVAWWKTETKPLALILTLIMAAKLWWEQTHGALPLSGEMPVVVNAHLYGEAGGLIGAAICWRDVLRMKPSWQRIIKNVID